MYRIIDIHESYLIIWKFAFFSSNDKKNKFLQEKKNKEEERNLKN